MVKYVLEHAEVRVQGPSGRAMIADAPSKPIKETLFALYVAQYASQMTQEEFVARWGEVGEVSIGLENYKAPNGEPIMKGKMWTTGYAKQGVDPRTSDQPWDAIDRAKTLAHQLADILNKHNCPVMNSEGSAPYYPFFIPLLGRITKTADLDAAVSQEAKDNASGAYAQRIERFGTYYGLFEKLQEYFEDGDSPEQLAAFQQVNTLAVKQLRERTTQRVYPDFVTFPTIFGGLNEDGSFVGVIVETAWT